MSFAHLRSTLPGTLAGALEAERYDRFGLEQVQLRMSCHVILTVIERYGIRDVATVRAMLASYPKQNWHADLEAHRERRS